MTNFLSLFAVALALFNISLLTACGGGGGGSTPGANDSSYSQGNSDSATTSTPEPTPMATQNPSNIAQFNLDCDLNGLNGELTLVVEAINTAGVVWGPGPNPDITAVIGTGSVLYVTSGSLVSSTASYGFTGDNQFADFFSNTTNERFRVEWVLNQNGLTMIVNPFGPGPEQHDCILRDSRFLQ